jgi:hypothetical protein
MTRSSLVQPARSPRKCLMFPPMNIRLLARRALKSSPVALLAVLAFGQSAGAATNEIEGVWSFGGGSVAIQQLSPTRFQGTVVTATTFATCPHLAGEVMWTNLVLRPDGSFWGFHQWLHGEQCLPVSLGETAWRVLKEPDGSRSLKVCFSTPNSHSQPMIAPDGTETGATYTPPCSVSSPLAPLPETEGPGGAGGSGGGSGSGTITFNKTVVLPPPTACVSQTSLKISLKNPKFDPLKEVVVKIGSKKVADVKGIKRLKKGITLKKLPTGTYKISVTATTILKQKLTGSQTYKSCTKGSGKIKLKGSKKHH